MKKQLLLLIAFMPFMAMSQISEIADINPSGDSSPSEFYLDSGGTLYFRANNGTIGVELYTYDGSTVTLLKDINVDPSSTTGNSNPNNFTEFGGKIYFRAFDGSEPDFSATEFWETDGTSANTKLVADINADKSSNPNPIFVLNGELYFTANDGPSTQIWALNGGTPVKFTTNNTDGFAGHAYPHIISTGAYMRVNDGNGNELAFFDGTGNSTEILDIKPGTGGGMNVFSDLDNIELLGDKLFFEGDSSSDDELWVSDGTAVGTFQVGFTHPAGNGDPDYLEVHQGEMFFAGEDADGYQLWKSNGTVVGTVLVSDMFSGGNGAVKNLYSDGTNLYFSATNGTDGQELWMYDGATATMLKDINTTGDSTPDNFILLNGMVYFTANDGTDTKLWITDGTSEGTNTVASQSWGSKDPVAVNNLIIRNGKLIFSGTGDNGNELFGFDPTTLAVGDNKLEIISVYPNPASDYLMVPNSLIGATYSIYDITGKSVKKGSIDSEKINLNLNSGIYMFKVETELSTVTKKIIVE